MFWNRKGRENADDNVDKDMPPDEKTIRRTVIKAARNNDPHATRQALVAWSRVMYPDIAGSSYEQFCKTAGVDLRQELHLLDSCLYGETDLPWDGEPLAACIAAWCQDKTPQRIKDLPDLYPR